MANGTLSRRASLGKVGLPAPGRPYQQDVGLGELDRLLLGCARPTRLPGLHPLVVVVDRDRQRLLGGLLADDVLLEELVDLPWLQQISQAGVRALAELFLDDLVAQVDALVADVDTGASDELLDLFLALPAERALEQVTTVADACHADSPSGKQCPMAMCPRRYPFGSTSGSIPRDGAREDRIGTSANSPGWPCATW